MAERATAVADRPVTASNDLTAATAADGCLLAAAPAPVPTDMVLTGEAAPLGTNALASTAEAARAMTTRDFFIVAADTIFLYANSSEGGFL